MESLIKKKISLIIFATGQRTEQLFFKKFFVCRLLLSVGRLFRSKPNYYHIIMFGGYLHTYIIAGRSIFLFRFPLLPVTRAKQNN